MVTVVTVCKLVSDTTVEVALAVVVPGVGVIVGTGASGIVGAFSPDLVRVHVIFVVLLVTVVSALVKSVFTGWHVLVKL